mgnify:FL=1
MLIKCKFLKENVPAGREYTYRSDGPVKVGDLVQINSSAKGVVTAVDVPEEEVVTFADKIKSIQGIIEADIILKNWCVVNAVSQQIQPPELIPKYFRGSIYGLPTLKDGYLRTTSPTVEILDYGDYKVIVTVTGSRYRIYPGDVALEAEAAYPGYYKRLNMEGK